jgi:hypothetical protein
VVKAMRARWSWSLGLSLAILAVARADDIHWHPVGAAPQGQQAADSPPVRLGRPLPAADPADASAASLPAGAPLPFRRIVRAQAPGGPVPAVPPPAPPPPPPPPPGAGFATAEEAYNCAPATGPAPAHPFLEGGRGFCENIRHCLGDIFKPAEGCALFQSDHHFDTFISPVTNPFYFEDPRSLTEVRPIFIHEQSPSSTPFFAGGPIDYAGLQARLAVTERLSFIVSELGWLWIDPHAPSGEFERANGFAELHLGPQFTIIRNEQTGTLLAGGLQFEIADGPARVFQSTGNLSLTPYASFGQQFGASTFGRFHFLNTTGFEFGIGHERTDRFFSSFHLDYDVLNWHKFYPLIELNYALYPMNGGERAIDFEGRDLINFGAEHVAGQNDLSLAFGARYKIAEPVWIGAAFEFPLLDRRDLMLWRLTFDLIFRY